jgi:hypothetical protein
MIWVKGIGLGAAGITLLVLFFQFIGRNFGGNFGYGEPVAEWPCNISDTVRDSGTRPRHLGGGRYNWVTIRHPESKKCVWFNLVTKEQRGPLASDDEALWKRRGLP